VEQQWVGRALRIGDVELSVTAPTPRCVVVALAQQDLAGDAEVLRTLARHNRVDVMGTGLFACLGVYASVVRTGRIETGNPVELT
ncbi:MAG TPA: MOSC domain-containing protein, partial [Mycobacteriales bacterium]|nr:MOSC domain-containing protein [Mycobacteriales bacterium]